MINAVIYFFILLIACIQGAIFLFVFALASFDIKKEYKRKSEDEDK